MTLENMVNLFILFQGSLAEQNGVGTKSSHQVIEHVSYHALLLETLVVEFSR